MNENVLQKRAYIIYGEKYFMIIKRRQNELLNEGSIKNNHKTYSFLKSNHIINKVKVFTYNYSQRD